MTATVKTIRPIIRGTDWQWFVQWLDSDGNPHDLALYEFDCQFKTEQGTEQPIEVSPDISIVGDKLRLMLTDAQTLNLEAGVLYFNLLATANGWTDEVCRGVITVDAGVTTP